MVIKMDIFHQTLNITHQKPSQSITRPEALLKVAE